MPPTMSGRRGRAIGGRWQSRVRLCVAGVDEAALVLGRVAAEFVEGALSEASPDSQGTTLGWSSADVSACAARVIPCTPAGFAGDIAFKMAREDGCQWMMHIDADEILIPSKYPWPASCAPSLLTQQDKQCCALAPCS